MATTSDNSNSGHSGKWSDPSFQKQINMKTDIRSLGKQYKERKKEVDDNDLQLESKNCSNYIKNVQSLIVWVGWFV